MAKENNKRALSQKERENKRLPYSKEKEGSNFWLVVLYLLRIGSQLSINKLKGEKLKLKLESPASTRLKQSPSLCF